MIEFTLDKAEARGEMVLDGNFLHPQVAEVVLILAPHEGTVFVADEPEDWAQTFRVGLYGAPTTTGEAMWCAAAKEMMKLCVCYDCRKNHLDPDNTDAADLGLCVDCLFKAELENEHSDGYHDEHPQEDCPECPECQ